jgi:N-acetylglucosamine-6-sulfatase
MSEQLAAAEPQVHAEIAQSSLRRRVGNALVGALILVTGASSEVSEFHSEAAHGSDTYTVTYHDIVPEPTQPETINHPNVVVILTDDLDWSLMEYMPYTTQLIGDAGAKLAIEDQQSLCCTSRSTLLTGNYTQNTDVIGNQYPSGGYVAFHRNDEKNTLAVWLQEQGYYDSFIGKYLNEYPWPEGNPSVGVANTFVPPGWNFFASPVAGRPYAQYGVELNVNGSVDASMRNRYFGDILSDMAVNTLASMPEDQPFFEEVSTYTPHKPYAYPARLEGTFTDVQFPRTPDFNEANVSDKPAPLHNQPPLSQMQIDHIDEVFRDRVRGVQVVDDMVRREVEKLKEMGILDNTYLIFTSDNSYFEGNHRRTIGKYDQYQSSLSVPMYVRGPGIQPGTDLRGKLLAGNVDFAPTVADMANVPVGGSVDGLSLLPALQGAEEKLDRQYLLIGRGDVPTGSVAKSGLEEPPEDGPHSRKDNLVNDFVGLLSDQYKYIAFSRGYDTDSRRQELYDRLNDPYELHNLLGATGEDIPTLTPEQRAAYDAMQAALPRMLQCAGVACNF